MRKAFLERYAPGNGWDETTYSLVFDEKAAEFYVERSWYNWSPKGVKQGSEKITLAELKKSSESAYQKAIEIITASFPDHA